MYENNCCVYAHVNLINGKKYFGITIQEPEKRWKNGYGYYQNAHFTNAIKKYGWKNFAHYVLYRNIPIKIAKNIEEMLIQEHFSYDPRFGYNKTYGGELEIPNNETRQKMSEAQKGHEVSKKTRQKISEAQKGRIHSEETRQKISKNNAMKNPEVAAKVSEALSKPVEAVDLESGQRVLYFKSTKDAGNAGFHIGHVSECCNGKRKSHCGLAWRFFEEVNDNDGNN